MSWLAPGEFVGYTLDPNTRVMASKYSDDILSYEEYTHMVQRGEMCRHCGEFLEYHGPKNQCLFEPTFFERKPA